MPAKSKAHYRGAYQKQAQAVRLAARLMPTTCARCGLPITADQAVDAGHVHDGQAGGALVAEHASCNRAAGAVLGNQRRRGLRTSRQW